MSFWWQRVCVSLRGKGSPVKEGRSQQLMQERTTFTAAVQAKNWANWAQVSQELSVLFKKHHLFICLCSVSAAARRIFSCDTWGWLPDQRLSLCPLHWERRALATGPPVKFRTYLYLFRFHHGRLLASDRREEILLLGVSNIDNMRV